ncbi:hypothetical protein Y717_31280 [Streptomyces scopuliridis RB72]|uniref:Uncharacterized protein n=1 Tax=Streptomyces scopuliridis RB72 TaxID=1440053 RepID=A0A2T7T986_9ACTN|nr:hypothetical protein Y717_31280 [Streptomyces scopuliridis RB72]
MAAFTYGRAAVGTPSPYASHRIPRARVSEIPAAHLLIVLKVAGATAMASGGGSGRGSPGLRQAMGSPLLERS